MANHTSSLKMIRKIARRTEVNRHRRNTARSSIKKVETAIEAKKKDVAQTAFRSAEPLMMSAAGKGIFSRKTMARKLSRLSAAIKAL
ncbi:MAG: 30S ribosomal protein S20 [Alphaproteobacteria bacterium]|jgi:small subunit ribosomal protein S20|nr:30S ribosomal protein S20 [Alphaproteobacteria bacterium]MBT5389136.1 30S ribosomal protein S20 [Alphaproteobacteria bacterium]MBT5654464.1 30S ribosomal protein S20 [Alphaproteobacteria bacterium]